MNVEHETHIVSIENSAIMDILSILKIDKTKTKFCVSSKFLGLNIDISKWGKDVFYIEIEDISNIDGDCSLAEIRRVCNYFGINPDDNDCRPWTEIIKEVCNA